jgi:hypothetical protein
VRAIDGDLDLVHELTLGGFDGPWARWSGGEAAVGDWRVVVRGGVSRVDRDGTLLRSRLVAPRGA